MKKILLLLLMVATLITTAQAETLKSGSAACVSKDLYDQFLSAAVKKDQPGLRYLFEHGCIITKDNFQISVLDQSWTGTAKVRAYLGDDAVVLWVRNESIQK